MGLWVSSLTNQNPEVRSTKKILMELNPTVFAYLERKRFVVLIDELFYANVCIQMK